MQPDRISEAMGLSLTELCGGDGGGTEGVRQALAVKRTTDREGERVMGQAAPTGKGVSVVSCS